MEYSGSDVLMRKFSMNNFKPFPFSFHPCDYHTEKLGFSKCLFRCFCFGKSSAFSFRIFAKRSLFMILLFSSSVSPLPNVGKDFSEERLLLVSSFVKTSSAWRSAISTVFFFLESDRHQVQGVMRKTVMPLSVFSARIAD